MDTEKLNRWLTLGANVGVLIGLLLLVLELNQNHEMMRAQTRHELAMGIVDILKDTAASEQLSNALYRSARGDALTPEEQFQVDMRTNALFRYWEDVHYQYRAGLYDDVEFGKQREAWRVSMTAAAGPRAYWCAVRLLYSPEFMAEMDALLPPDGCRQQP